MSDKKNFDPESISLIDFKLLKGNVETPVDFDVNMVAGHDLENNLEFGFNIDDQLAKTNLLVEIKTKSQDKITEEASCSYHLIFLFKIEGMGQFVTIDEKKLITVHPAVANALAAVSYSTARGVLLSRLQGTAFSNFILPVLNTAKLLSKP